MLRKRVRSELIVIAQRPSRLIPLAIVALALTGAWVSGSLLVGHDGGWRAAGADNWLLWGLCETVTLPSANCAEVVGSRWGSFDLVIGSRRLLIPTSFVGLVYFMAAAVWFALVSPVGGASRWLRRMTLLVLSCGLAGSLFFAAVMASSLSEWCPLCVVAHVVNVTMFVATLWLWRRCRKARAGGSTAAVVSPLLWAQRRSACLAAVTAVGATVGLWLYYDAASEARRQWRKVDAFERMIVSLQSDPDFMLREYYAQPIVAIGEGRNGLASPADTTSMVVFGNYDCSACACFESRWNKVYGKAFDPWLRVDYRYAAREQTSLSRSRDPEDAPAGSHLARRAAEAARLQGGDEAYSKMHALLFKHRKDKRGRDYAELARLGRLDIERFKADMQSETVRRKVEEDTALAARLGVTATPTVFLNGRKVPELCLKSRAFWMAIAADLNRSSQVASRADGDRSHEIGEEAP